MSAGWVAACVRGQQLLRHAAGTDTARAIASASSWPDARELLADTIYGESMPADADRRTAKRCAFEAVAWELRVLAGWLPPTATSLARAAVAPIEIANIEQHLRGLSGDRRSDPIDLGSLAGVSHRLATASSPGQVRDLLARSVWGDPGGDDRRTIAFGLRVAWARRATLVSDLGKRWARAAAAVLVARESLAFGRPIAGPASRDLDRLLGRRWKEATDLVGLRALLPASTRWVLADVDEVDELWRAELAVVGRVASDAADRLSSARYGSDALTATLALLLVDLWQVSAAIEVAGSGSSVASEVLDVVAG